MSSSFDIKRKSIVLARRYRAALRRYFKQGAAASLKPAVRLGHQAVKLGLETLDLALIHEQAMVAQALPISASTARDLLIKRAKTFFAGTAYRRTRPDENGIRTQRLEVRFDGVAGCLRTPNGGSSRQTVILVEKGVVRSRLMTVRECARLMGTPDTYRIQGTYNDGYRAMGDAVAVPVTRWLKRHLLMELAARSRNVRVENPATRSAA